MHLPRAYASAGQPTALEAVKYISCTYTVHCTGGLICFKHPSRPIASHQLPNSGGGSIDIYSTYLFRFVVVTISLPFWLTSFGGTADDLGRKSRRPFVRSLGRLIQSQCQGFSAMHFRAIYFKLRAARYALAATGCAGV